MNATAQNSIVLMWQMYVTSYFAVISVTTGKYRANF